MTDFTAQLTAALKEYSNTCEQEIQKVIDDVSKETKKMLLKSSPKGRRGIYRKGWRVTIERRSGFYKAHVHNSEYSLVHLIEHGHATNIKHGNFGWKPFTSPHVHVAHAEKWAVKEVEKRIKEVLQG